MSGAPRRSMLGRRGSSVPRSWQECFPHSGILQEFPATMMDIGCGRHAGTSCGLLDGPLRRSCQSLCIPQEGSPPPGSYLRPARHADRRVRNLDHFHVAAIRVLQGRMRERHGGLLRGGRRMIDSSPMYGLVAAGDRLRPSKARAPLHAISRLKRSGLLATAGPTHMEQSRRFWGVPGSTSFRFTSLAGRASADTLRDEGRCAGGATLESRRPKGAAMIFSNR